MKLLLSWIQNHIVEPISEEMLPELVAKFNTSVAEVDKFIAVNFEVEAFAVAKFVNSKLYFPGNKKVFVKSDGIEFKDGDFFLLKFDNNDWRLANFADFGQIRVGPFPPLFLTDLEFEQSLWRNFLPEKDYIFEVDNKSLTNRPDMWGHRGFAREIALIGGYSLKPESELLAVMAVVHKHQSSFMTEDFSFENFAPEVCSGFSLTKYSGIKNLASLPKFAFPLAIIGEKPISSLVDLTNYLMFDWGHPVHAFDADLIGKKTLNVRMARDEEKILLLGENQINLTSQDLIVASDEPLALAGIKGGLLSSVSHKTTNILLEAACFDPTIIRRSSTRHKIRTESSARFEKKMTGQSLEQVQKRFLSLLSSSGLFYASQSETHIFLGEEKILTLEVKHTFLEEKIGISLNPDEICYLLNKLEFKVGIVDVLGEVVYKIIVPFFRSSKNVQTREDIFEEVARLIGFERVKTIVPKVVREPFDLSKILRKRAIKKQLAYGEQMIEQANYPFYDEAFLQEIGYEPGDALSVLNPVSTNYKRLVKSLVPGLLKNVQTNFFVSENLSFFEIAKVWIEVAGKFVEKEVLSGIIFARNNPLSFYFCKQKITNLFSFIGKVQPKWTLFKNVNCDLSDKDFSAGLDVDNFAVGSCGMIGKKYLQAISHGQKTEAFFFEIDTEILFDENFIKARYQSINKFQNSFVDISGYLPEDRSYDEFLDGMKDSSVLVTKVLLVDWFEKNGKTSVTLRLMIELQDRAVDKEDLNSVSVAAKKVFEKLGGIVR